MLETITNAIGLTTFALLLLGGSAWLLRRAADHDLLKPVLVGAGLRLLVMIGAHIASLAAGKGGTLVVDDVGFLDQGAAIAEPWINGQIVDLTPYTSSISNGFPALVAGVFVLVGPSVFAAKLVNVLLGSATVLLAGLIGGRLFGGEGKSRAAWIVALMPTLVWWSAEMIKEPLVGFLVAAAILAMLSRPTLRVGLALLALLAALYWTRPTALLALLIGAAIAFGYTALRHRRVLDRRVLGINLAWLVGAFLAVGFLMSSGNPLGAADVLVSTARSMADEYRDGSVAQVVADFSRTFLIPFPWNVSSPIGWDRALIPGVWVLIVMLPTAALGIWRMRRRPELLLILVPIISSSVIYALTAGATYRQRSSLEPLLALLFVAGADSWRGVLVRGGLILLPIAPLAAIHVGSPLTGLLVGLAGAGLIVVGRRLEPASVRVPLRSNVLLTQLQSLDVPRPSRLLPLLQRLRDAGPPIPGPAPQPSRHTH